jgi:hypothetical protein
MYGKENYEKKTIKEQSKEEKKGTSNKKAINQNKLLLR